MNKIAFAKPDVGMDELEKVREVLESGWLTTGPKVKEFEEKIACIAGCAEAVAVDSCTTALEFSLRMLGIGEGDEVITTPLTYTATADVIHAVGAKIVFADTDGKSFEMDYDDVERRITENTKAVIAVDYGGKVCDYGRLIEIAERKKKMFCPANAAQYAFGRIAVIADAAHSFGANAGKGRKSGSYADITCFSFHVLKNITTGGEGGAICFKQGFEFFADELRMMRHHYQTGKSRWNGWEYDILGMGHNRPMTDIDAAIGLVQLERFDEIKKKRVEITKFYDSAFSGEGQIRPLLDHMKPGGESAYHLYPVEVLTKKGAASDYFRNEIILKMMENGVACNVHYKPLPMFTAYRNLGFRIIDYPNAYRKYMNLITIPYHSLLGQDQLEYIVEQLRKAVDS